MLGDEGITYMQGFYFLLGAIVMEAGFLIGQLRSKKNARKRA